VLPAVAAPGHAPALAQSIARIALTQVGAADSPAATSFSEPDCDPYSTLVGAGGPNAFDCGLSKTFNIQDQNEPWCSDFVKWVWQRAGVTQDIDMLSGGASSFYTWGLRQHQELRPDRGRPAVGDAVVFYPRGRITRRSGADHVGIVTGVNRDGTVDLVNGDFIGPSNISVSYDERVHLRSWASRIWNRGEQWVLVAPPSGRQPAAPALRITGPRVAVAGTSVRFGAYGSGAVASYQWTFGDGGAWDVSGRAVSHVFTQDGLYPVTVTATSWLGTATTRTLDVVVTGVSSPVASVPDVSEWYSPTIDTYLFHPAAGRLTAGRRDGRHWRYAAVPGRPDRGSGLTALSYPDPHAADAMTPHAYYISHGLLSETYLGRSGWTFSPLAGRPAAGSAIVALASASGPSVFYFGAGGRLTSSAWDGHVWIISRITGPAASTAGSLALAATTSGPDLFYLHRSTLLVTHRAGARWLTAAVRSRLGVTPDSPLAAVTAGAHQVDVFFVDRTGNLAVAAQGRHGWTVSQLPGAPAVTPLMAAAYPLGGHSTAGMAAPVGIAVFYRTRTGQPGAGHPGPGRPAARYSAAATYWSRGGWRAAVLRGSLSQDEAAGLDSLSQVRSAPPRPRAWLARSRPGRTG
jgi:PKD repeat protein